MKEMLNALVVRLYTRKCRTAAEHSQQGPHTAHLTWLGRRHYAKAGA